MLPHEKTFHEMRRGTSLWGNGLPHEEAWFLTGSVFPQKEAHFLKRNLGSSWRSMFLHKEALFLMNKHVSSWGNIICFILRKQGTSSGYMLHHEETSCLRRKHGSSVGNVFSYEKVDSSWGCPFPHKESLSQKLACFLILGGNMSIKVLNRGKTTRWL